MEQDKSATTATVNKQAGKGLEVICLKRSACEEYFLTAVPVEGELPHDIFARLGKTVREYDLQIISQEIFGISDHNGGATQALKEHFPDINWPITWLENGKKSLLAGCHIWAVKGLPVETVELEGKLVGTYFGDGEVQFCRLGGIVAEDAALSRTEQARRVLEKMQAALQTKGMDFHNVIRTWFYNHKILEWYGEFNRVRDQYFRENDIFSGLVPASTGIGGSNIHKRELVSGLLAVKGTNNLKAMPLASPLQCPAMEYGSSFSRAVEIDMVDHRRIFVSGTASIEPGGKTVHIGDATAQVELTMQVVAAILQSRDMEWHNVTRALAYFKHAKDAQAYHDFCARNDICDFPVVIVENDVCRDDLLYEIEVDAIKSV